MGNMPTGALLIPIADMAGQPLRTRVEVDLKPLPGNPGVGGARMELEVNMGASTELHVTGIACRGGLATMYEVSVAAAHYRRYRFFQPIFEDRINPASEDVAFWVKPGDVADIVAPRFDDLSARSRRILDTADMRRTIPGDDDLIGPIRLQGDALYRKLGPLRQAGFLNIARKASHRATADDCWALVRTLLVSRQDRLFALVDPAMQEFVHLSPVYGSADPALHKPLPGFELTGQSVKSKDAHANLQVTFMRNVTTGEVAADIDIDESSGVEHGFEVIRNAIFNQRTNPYLIREFLLAADPREHTLDPGYRFTFA
jgi:hypothetical protein